MKRLFFLLIVSCCVNSLSAQTYRPVDKSSSVKVMIKNSGMEIDGKLSGLEGEIRFNPAELKTAFFSVSLDAGTINTGIDVRDENLKGDEYLDSKKFPRISFVSKQISQTKPNTFSIKGTLTIKGISKDISIPFTTLPKNDGMVFNGEFRINRQDFKIGVGSLVLSDNMTISLNVFAKKE